MKNKRNFIAQQGGPHTVKIFDAATGQLFRIINVGYSIATPPVCTDRELSVGVYIRNKVVALRVYSVPGFSLKKTITL